MKKFLLAAAVAMAGVASMAAQDVDIYIIGSNVNGKSWTLSAEDAKFTYEGGGIYKWNGEVLGTGFKLNDGTWSNDEYNLGCGPVLELGQEYFLTAGGASGNIAFDGFTELLNPEVTFDDNNKSIVVTGEKSGVIQWYITGVNGNYNLDENELLTEILDENGEGTGVYEKKGLVITETGGFKVSSTGWATQYGTYDEDLYFGFEILAATLEEVGGEGGLVNYFMTGTYDVTWDGNTKYISFVEHNDNAVETIEAADAAASYYTLQGVRVAQPENGLFICVKGGKASKVLVK